MTFDDGYRELGNPGRLPLLRSHGVSAVFFLATGFVDRPRTPWWYELSWMVGHSANVELPSGQWLAEPLPLGARSRGATIEALLDTYKALPGDRSEAFLDWVAETGGSGRCDPSAVRDDWLTWDMARELHDAGMEIGGHTIDHPILARLPADEQKRQIEGCARRIEVELDRPMRMFSYPVGLADSFGETARTALHDEGVRFAFGYHGGFARSGAFDPFDLPRVTGGMHIHRSCGRRWPSLSSSRGGDRDAANDH